MTCFSLGEANYALFNPCLTLLEQFVKDWIAISRIGEGDFKHLLDRSLVLA